MQLASSSAMLDHLFSRGEFTQLEWIDFAARSLAVDGLVFDLRHFPRHDLEYLAEVRKLCVDRGLTIAALGVDDLFVREEQGLDTVFAIASTIGAPLIIAEPPPVTQAPAYAWREAAHRGKVAARLAKLVNVTIGVRNTPGTLCENLNDLKRLTKDVDSSWLRFAPDLASLPREDIAALAVRTVALMTRALDVDVEDRARKGFFILDQREPNVSIPEHAEAVRRFSARLNAIGRG